MPLRQTIKFLFEAFVLAWILRHPAQMQPIVSSMNPQRNSLNGGCFDSELSRADWYKIYRAQGNHSPKLVCWEIICYSESMKVKSSKSQSACFID